MNSRSRSWILLVLLPGSAVCFCFLLHHARINGELIAALGRRAGELKSARPDSQALRRISSEIEELEDLGKGREESVRLRSEVERLQSELEKRNLAATRTVAAQASRLREENSRLQKENRELGESQPVVLARQLVDEGELMQIAQGLALYAKMNDSALPKNLAELKHYTTAQVFETLETNRFELLHVGKLTDIADPSHTALARVRAKDAQNQRPYLYADGHLEVKDE